jgi:endo-1,4-beta-xylanase
VPTIKSSFISLRTAGLICLLVTLAVVGIAIRIQPAETQSPVRQDKISVHTPTSLLDRQWSYMPGVSRHNGILHIAKTSRIIVNQDGSGGQPNAPVNLYGTHLENASSFAVEGTVQGRSGIGSIQLYGVAPIIADEFRVERRSVRLAFTDTGVRITAWGANHATLIIDKPFALPPTSASDFTFSYAKNTLDISVNGQHLASIDAQDIFSDGRVWFGLDSSKYWQLTKLDVLHNGNEGLVIADGSTLAVKAATSSGLQQLAKAKRHDFTIGAAMAIGPLTTDPEYAELALGGNFGSLTTENALKWQFVHPRPGFYDFRESDAIVALASRHRMTVHGHPLVFGEGNPPWINRLPTATIDDKAKVRSIMNEHIRTVVARYKGKISSWDVINEPLGANDPSELRNHLWHKAMGKEYIAEALRTAHETDPDARLFINEWGLEMDDARWNALISLVSDLQRQKVPLDGIGFQSHIYHRSDVIDSGKLRQRLQQLAALGLQSRISEIDVYAYDGPFTQAKQYAGVLSVCLQEPTCKSYTTWGVSDRYNTYKDGRGNIQFGQDYLWNADMDPTFAIQEMRRVLETE